MDIPVAFYELEKRLGAVGINSPVKIWAATTALTGAVVFAVKPSFFFKAGGQPRAWAAADPTDDSAAPVPWWLFANAVGLGLSLIV